MMEVYCLQWLAARAGTELHKFLCLFFCEGAISNYQVREIDHVLKCMHDFTGTQFTQQSIDDIFRGSEFY
jgi:hypothetical protein